MIRKLTLFSLLSLLAFSNVQAQQWYPQVSPNCQSNVNRICNTQGRYFAANRFRRGNLRHVYRNSNGCSPQVVARPIACSLQIVGYPMFSQSRAVAWGHAHSQSASVLNRCDCQQIYPVGQQGAMQTDQNGKTLTVLRANICPKEFLFESNQQFYYSAINCPSGKPANVILIYAINVAVGCNGANCNAHPVVPIGQIDLEEGTILTPAAIEKIRLNTISNQKGKTRLLPPNSEN